MLTHAEIRAMMPGLDYRVRTVDLLGGEGWSRSSAGLYVPASALPLLPGGE